MRFPTMAAIDAATFGKLADDDEWQCVYKPRSGAQIPIVAIINDDLLEAVDENGALITVPRREAEILRTAINEPEEGAILIHKSIHYRLLKMIRRDEGSSVWSIARPGT